MLMLDKQNYWFDAFGTLIDDKGTKTYSKKILEIFERYEIDLKQIPLTTTKFSENPKDFFDAILRFQWKNVNFMSESHKKELIDIFKAKKQVYKLKPYTEEVLAKLKENKKTIFLISNLASLYVPIVRKLLGWKWIDKFYYSCDIGMKKTMENSDIFNFVLQDLKIQAQDTFFTGDKLERDVIPPSKVGIESCLIDKFFKCYKI